MRKKQSTILLDEIRKLSDPEIDRQNLPIAKEKVAYRRKHVNKLHLQGMTNKEIVKRIGCGESTVEKDLNAIRESSREWFEEDSITEYCNSLHDGVVLIDCVIEELQLIYQEEDDYKTKIEVMRIITEFQNKKTKLYEKTKAVKKFIGGTP